VDGEKHAYREELTISHVNPVANRSRKIRGLLLSLGGGEKDSDGGVEGGRALDLMEDGLLEHKRWEDDG